MTETLHIPTLPWLNYAVALGLGLLIGLERERNKGDGPQRSPAGIRTFSLTALVGAVAGQWHIALLIVAGLAIVIWLAIAYWRQQQEDPGLTTEVALFLTLLLGALAITQPALAAALAVTTTVLLALRRPLHHFAQKVLSESEIHSALVLAASTLVILPLLPDHGLGPYQAINPHKIWTIVVLIMTISAFGHVMLRWLGPRLGLPLVGLFSGFVSSAMTIGVMGQRARDTPALGQPAVAAAVLSNVATLLQMMAILALVHWPTLRALLPALASATLIALLYGGAMTWRSWRQTQAAAPTIAGPAFRARTALALGLALAGLQWLSAAAQVHFGELGVLWLNALAGFGDTHAPAVAIATLAAEGRFTPAAAALPILAAYSTNSLSKMGIACLSGDGRYAVAVVPGILLILMAVWLSWWLLS